MSTTSNVPRIRLRPITDDDQEFLFQLYASTRDAEKKLVGWPDEQWQSFMQMQFNLQHTQYMANYLNATFQIALLDGIPVGRLYVDRKPNEYRLIDIAVLPAFQRQDIAGTLLGDLLKESDERSIPIGLHVDKSNPALAYYLELGFVVQEDKGVYLFMTRKPEAMLERPWSMAHPVRGDSRTTGARS